MSNADLWTTKVKGASEEKIRRSYEAIALYNDTVATGDNECESFSRNRNRGKASKVKEP
jgi:hypothetical protein